MSSYKPIDSKREEFRKYLERTGVLDALTKGLVALYEETDKPEDALGYMRSYMGGSSNGDCVKGMQKQMEDMKIKTEKTEGSVINESGEQGSSQTEEVVKAERDGKSFGAEGDGPSTRGSGDKGSSAGDGIGKPIAESVSPDATA